MGAYVSATKVISFETNYLRIEYRCLLRNSMRDQNATPVGKTFPLKNKRQYTFQLINI